MRAAERHQVTHHSCQTQRRDTPRGAAAEVAEQGARAKKVLYSMDEMAAATKALKAAPRVAGTSWAIDPSSNEVVVRADRTVSAGDWAKLTQLAEEIGGPVRMERISPGGMQVNQKPFSRPSIC